VLALDLAGREAWEVVSTIGYSIQLLAYHMDSEQLELKAQLAGINYFNSGATLYPVGNGAVLIVLPNAIVLIP